jgi:hypothetical protein
MEAVHSCSLRQIAALIINSNRWPFAALWPAHVCEISALGESLAEIMLFCCYIVAVFIHESRWFIHERF